LHNLVGSEWLGAGILRAEPNTTSPVHHHGHVETVVYIVAGRGQLRWGNRLEHEVDLEPGNSANTDVRGDPDVFTKRKLLG
jgi:uncharacterized RmlC-like cupin family protein